MAESTPAHSLRIGIDLDGVIYPFVDILRDWLQSEGHDVSDMGPATRWEFYKDWGFTTPQFLQHFADGVNAGFVFRTGDPYPGASDMLWRLHDLGHSLHAVTSRDIPGAEVAARAATYAWCGEQGFPFDSITIAADKAVVDTHLFIEDHVDNYDHLDGIGETHPVLLHQQWNAHHQTARRIESLDQFVDYVTNATHEFDGEEDGHAVCGRCTAWVHFDHLHAQVAGMCEGDPAIQYSDDGDPLDDLVGLPSEDEDDEGWETISPGN